MLTKEQIRERNKRRLETVPVPEWGGDVCVRSLTVPEQAELESEMATLDDSDIAGHTSIQLAFYVANEDGSPMYTIAEMRAEAPWDATAASRILRAARKLNRGLTVESLEEAKKNS